jgi:hypothetical protein
VLPSCQFSLSQPLLRGSAWALTKSCFTLISLFETKNPFHRFKQSLNCRLVLSCIHSNSQEQMKMESNMTLINIKPQTTTLWHNKPKIQPSHYFPSPLWDCTPSDLALVPHSTLFFFCFLCTCSVGLKTRFMEIRDWLIHLLNQLLSHHTSLDMVIHHVREHTQLVISQVIYPMKTIIKWELFCANLNTHICIWTTCAPVLCFSSTTLDIKLCYSFSTIGFLVQTLAPQIYIYFPLQQISLE